MTDITALDALIEAVTDGRWDQVAAWKALGIGKTGRAERTFNGSLDAAKALHEALLPGWAWSIEVANVAEVWPLHKASVAVRVFADEATPARAWLLAILKAYRAGL